MAHHPPPAEQPRAADPAFAVVGVALLALGLAVATGAVAMSAALAAVVGLVAVIALTARHRPGAFRRAIPHSPDRTPRPARHREVSTMDLRTSAQKAAARRGNDRDGAHIVEYQRGAPWADAGKRQKIRAGSRREAGVLAQELRASGSKVTAVRRKRWFE